MKKLSTTLESCSPYVTLIASLPGDLQQFIYNRDDLLQQYLASPAYARQCKSHRIEVATLQCYQDHRVYLESFPTINDRAKELREKLANALARPGCRYDLTDAPDLRTIKKVLNSNTLESS